MKKSKKRCQFDAILCLRPLKVVPLELNNIYIMYKAGKHKLLDSIIDGIQDKKGHDIVIVDLEKNVPQRIRMFVWIEGQDVDCQSLESGGSILLSLELAGGNN